jgi:hypothetical protein
MQFCMARGLAEQSLNLQNHCLFRTSLMWQSLCSHRWMHVTTRPIHGDANTYFCAERRRVQDGAFGWLMEVYRRRRTTKSSRDSTALSYKCGSREFNRRCLEVPLGQEAGVDGFLVVTFHPPYDHGSRAGVTWHREARVGGPADPALCQLSWRGWRTNVALQSQEGWTRQNQRQSVGVRKR